MDILVGKQNSGGVGGQYGSNQAAGDYDSSTGGQGGGYAGGAGAGSGFTSGGGRGGLAEDRSDAYGAAQGGPGNQGVSGYTGDDSTGISSGAAGTDRFDVGRGDSGAYGSSGGAGGAGGYGGVPGGNKGGLQTGDNYDDSNTTGGDGHGKPGLLEKVKNVISGH